MKRAREANKPFYIHLRLNDVHDPFTPIAELLKKNEQYSPNKYLQQ